MQLAVKAAELPSAVRIGKKEIEPNEDGFIIVEAKKLLSAVTKAPKGRSKQKTFYSLGREGTYEDHPIAKIYTVDFENVERENLSSYVNYFRTLAAKLGRDLYIHDSHDKNEVPRRDGRRLHIFPYCSPGTGDIMKSEFFDGQPTAENLSIDFKIPSFLGNVYGDKEGLGLAEWKENNLYILWDLMHMPFSENAATLLDRIFDGSLQRIENQIIEDKETLKRDLKRIVDRDFQQYVQNRDREERNVRNLEEQLLESYRQVTTLNAMLKDVESAKEKKIDTAIQDIEEIVKLNGVCNVKFRNGSLEIYTYPVILEDRDLGGFKILIQNDGVMFEALSSTQRRPHPHINGGNACLGNLGNAVQKMIARREYLALASFLLEFLHSYNEGDAYGPLKECGKKYEAPEETAGQVIDPIDPDGDVFCGMLVEGFDGEEGQEGEVPEERD